MHPPGFERTCDSCRAKQALQKKRIKHGVFQKRPIVIRGSMHVARADAVNCDATMAGTGRGRGQKYFCKTVDTLKKRD